MYIFVHICIHEIHIIYQHIYDIYKTICNCCSSCKCFKTLKISCVRVFVCVCVCMCERCILKIKYMLQIYNKIIAKKIQLEKNDAIITSS